MNKSQKEAYLVAGWSLQSNHTAAKFTKAEQMAGGTASQRMGCPLPWHLSSSLMAWHPLPPAGQQRFLDRIHAHRAQSGPRGPPGASCGQWARPSEHRQSVFLAPAHERPKAFSSLFSRVQRGLPEPWLGSSALPALSGLPGGACDHGKNLLPARAVSRPQ